jgi:hypothetical protein
MDHGKIIKQSWNNLLRYRALWIFGIILALTTFSWEQTLTWRAGDSGNREEDGERYIMPLDEVEQEKLNREIEELVEAVREPEVAGFWKTIGNTILIIALIIVSTILLLIVIGKVLRYISETAIIRMVNDKEDTEEKIGMRKGFQMGWSRTSWKLFFIDLMIDLPLLLIFVVLFSLVIAPIIGATQSNFAGRAFLIVLAVGLFFLDMFLVFVTAVTVPTFKHFIRRACVLEEMTVPGSIQRGVAMVWKNIKDVGLMWLIQVGISLGFPVLLFPVVVLLIAVGVLVGGMVAFIIGSITTGVATIEAGVLAGSVAALPIFILIIGAPITFLSGLREVFQSSSWTLTYRELLSLEKLNNGLNNQDMILDAQT